MSKRFLIALGVAALALVAAFYFFKNDSSLLDPDQDPDQDPGQDPDQDPGKVHQEITKKPEVNEPGTEETS